MLEERGSDSGKCQKKVAIVAIVAKRSDSSRYSRDYLDEYL